jgi:hypothetical protein
MPDVRRLDWPDVRSRVDLVAIATDLLGPAQRRKGANSGKRSWWSCPFHHDPNPSFCVEVGTGHYKCFGCGEHGDAATLVMKIMSVDFPAAVRHLAGELPRGPRRPSPAKGPTRRRPHATPDDNLSRDAAEALVDDAIARLWSEAGADSLAYLSGRGLEEGTILAARLGLVDRPLSMPGGPLGLVVPWYVGGELALIKLRQPEGRRPKYRQIFIDPALHAGIFPDPEDVRPGRPLIIAEGEFDALLLAQELEDLDVGVITLGSASMRPTSTIRASMLPASPWIVAADADEAGEKFAECWPASALRFRPTSPDKDWTETHARGWNLLRYWWTAWLRDYRDVPTFPGPDDPSIRSWINPECLAEVTS